jgi:hypothetical protein
MQKLLVTVGGVLVAAGLLWPYLSRLGLGRLPGDIAIQGEHGGFYFPIVTCLVISVVVSAIFWFTGKF